MNPVTEREEKDKPTVTERECEQVVRAFAACNYNDFLLEFLGILRNLFEADDRVIVSRIVGYLEKYGLREILLSFIYNAVGRREASMSTSKRRNTFLNPSMEHQEMDRLVSECIMVAQKIIFENCANKRNNKAGLKSNDANFRKAERLLVDFLLGAPEKSNSDKREGKVPQSRSHLIRSYIQLRRTTTCFTSGFIAYASITSALGPTKHC